MNWDINTEPDFNHYELWKKNSPTSDWEIYASVCTTNSINDLGNMYPDVFYKIRAVDNSNKKSVFTKEINVKPSVVSENTTWSGNFLINFDVTVNPGVTLTIANNSNLAFNSGKKLIVKGKLTAIGTSSNPIVFTSPNPYTPGPGDWQGIRFINGNSGSKLDYCNISYATNGIYVDNTDIEVKHSYIENNSNSGIMAVNGSDIFMQYNTVEDNYFGVYCQYDALGYLGDYYIKGGNRIDDHWIGLECNYDSYMFLGRSGWYPCDNSIYNTGYYRAIAMFGGDIKAEVTWWGTSSPSGSLFMANGYGRTIDYSPWLTYDPGYGSPLESIDKAGSTDKPLAPAVNKDDPASLFKGGEYFKGNKDYEKAGELWKLLIDRFPENEYAIKALVQLYHLDKNTEPTDVKAYLQNLRNKKALPVELTRKALILSSYSALHEDNLSSARSLVNEMHTNHEGTQAEVYGLYLQATMPEVGDASSAIKTLKTKYPDNILTIIAREIKAKM
ncbi:MAG: hypothetical protein JXB44_04045 [Calditrichaceae bacterium]|nr:hypothetical protein [Calditrichaceae bacterium]RQV96488.1 MAG: hypothetical protein EH224_04525 [Calditrichota bacterium]